MQNRSVRQEIVTKVPIMRARPQATTHGERRRRQTRAAAGSGRRQSRAAPIRGEAAGLELQRSEGARRGSWAATHGECGRRHVEEGRGETGRRRGAARERLGRKRR